MGLIIMYREGVYVCMCVTTVRDYFTFVLFGYSFQFGTSEQ